VNLHSNKLVGVEVEAILVLHEWAGTLIVSHKHGQSPLRLSVRPLIQGGNNIEGHILRVVGNQLVHLLPVVKGCWAPVNVVDDHFSDLGLKNLLRDGARHSWEQNVLLSGGNDLRKQMRPSATEEEK